MTPLLTRIPSLASRTAASSSRGVAGSGARRALMRAAAAAAIAWPAVAAAVLPIEHWTTPTGAHVLFVRAPSIPMLDVSVSFDAGDRYDPVGRSGVASMTAAMLAKGAPGLDEPAIAERFASVGAQRGASAGDDRAVVSLRSLTARAELETALSTLEAVLASPTFPEAVLEREKARVIQSLRDAQTRPETIARQAFARLLYPRHPYGEVTTPESIASIGRDDLVRFHRAHYSAGRAVVAMIGAVDRAQAESIAARLTARLPAGETPPAPVPVELPATAAERRIAHPASQSHILIGAPGVAWGDPDQFALLVGNYVLGGGGFVSRLYGEVREKRGLAYSVYSYFSPAAQPGPFTVGLQTQREQTGTALQVVRETLERYFAEGPTDAEVEAAKSNLVGGFALRIDSNRKILDYLSVIGFHRLPLDYLDRWTERVSQVTTAQVRDALARFARGRALQTVVVGDDGGAK